jgi:hypothetical protein
VPEIRLARIRRLVAPVAQIAFGHHPKRADGCERPAIVKVQFVSVIAIHHDLPFESAGQFETFEEYISWIAISFASVPIAVTNVATVARSVWFAFTLRLMAQLYPRHLDVADIISAAPWIKVEHEILSSSASTISFAETTRVIM